jgi:hypothetical protein
VQKFTTVAIVVYGLLMGRARQQAHTAHARRATAATKAEKAFTVDADGFTATSYYLDNDKATGILHREHGPAFVRTGPEGSSVEYYDNGLLSRADGPASVVVSADGTRTEKYYWGGALTRGNSTSREELPAVIITSADGARVEERYYEDGLLHREGFEPIIVVTTRTHRDDIDPGSADYVEETVVVSEYENGYRTEQHLRDGILHREDGPALIRTLVDGGIEETWHRDGLLHREDGPALIEIRADGTRIELYYCEGFGVSKDV